MMLYALVLVRNSQFLTADRKQYLFHGEYKMFSYFTQEGIRSDFYLLPLYDQELRFRCDLESMSSILYLFPYTSNEEYHERRASLLVYEMRPFILRI